MLKLFSGLIGAGSSFAGFIPFVPWLLAALLGLAGAGGWFYEQHQTEALKTERDAALVKLGAAQAVVQDDEATIASMQANDRTNDALIEAYQHQVDEDAKISTDAGTQLRNLANADQTVSDYLSTAIPCSLQHALNGAAASGAGADQDCGLEAAKAKPVPAAP